MRALVCTTFGEGKDLAVAELPIPRPDAGQVQIEVHRAGVAYVDALVVRDKHQSKHELPFAPGMAVAGVIRAVGDQVDNFSVGARVMAIITDGGLAEFAIAPAVETFAIPPDMDFTTAAALVSGYFPAHAAFRWDANLSAGETLLVLGASGTMGTAAVQVGRAFGARVIAAASTPEKVAVAVGKGANEGVCYGEQDLYETVMELTNGDGADVVFDPVGGPLYEPAFRTVGWGGRYVIVGFTGGAIPQIPANRLLIKNRKAIGFVLKYYRTRRLDLLAQTAAELCDLQMQGKLDASPTVIELDDAGTMIDEFYNRRAMGNVVVNI
jgi:NADPH:quinone reductase